MPIACQLLPTGGGGVRTTLPQDVYICATLPPCFNAAASDNPGHDDDKWTALEDGQAKKKKTSPMGEVP